MAKKTTTRKPVRVLKKKAAPKKKAAKKKAAADATPEIEFFPREHTLVPPHEVLNQEEVEALFIRYKVSPQNLPVIFADDAALKGMDVKMGDIIKVTRVSPTAGEAIFFRRVAYE